MTCARGESGTRLHRTPGRAGRGRCAPPAPVRVAPRRRSRRPRRPVWEPAGRSRAEPNVRWSANTITSSPCSGFRMANRTRSWRSAGAPGSRSSICPLMPRCTMIASGVSDASSAGLASSGASSHSHRNLPRLTAARMPRPTSRASKSAAEPAWRVSARESKTSTLSIVASTIAGLQAVANDLDLRQLRHAPSSRERRASSKRLGAARSVGAPTLLLAARDRAALAEPLPQRERGRHLGVLLARALTLTRGIRDGHRRREAPLVVGPAG